MANQFNNYFRERLKQIDQRDEERAQSLKLLHVRLSCLLRFLGIEELHRDTGDGKMTIDFRWADQQGAAEAPPKEQGPGLVTLAGGKGN